MILRTLLWKLTDGMCGEMKDVMILRELDQIKAISQVYRLDIIDAFNNEEATAKMISERLNESHAKINYHIKILVKVGILKLVREKIKLGIVEKYYLPIAKKYVVDSGSLNSNKEMTKTLNKVSVAFFEHLSKDFYGNIENGTNEPPKKINYLEDIYLTDEEADELNDEINNCIDNFIKGKDVQKGNTNKYSITTLLIPVIK